MILPTNPRVLIATKPVDFRKGMDGLAAIVALAGLGALYYLSHRLRREPSPDLTPTIVGSFRPVGPGRSEFEVSDGVRPGQVGTLMDGRADPVDLADVAAPVLVVQGVLDRVVPPAHGEWMAQVVPDAELWLRPDDGHVSVLDAVPAAMDWLLER